MAMKRFIKVVSKLFLIGLVSLFISGAGLFSSKSEELATDQNVKNKNLLQESKDSARPSLI